MDNAAFGFTEAGNALLLGTPDQQHTVEEEEPDCFLPVLLPSRKLEKKNLGKPQERSTCFLCCYCGERNTTLPSDDVNKIVEMIRTYFGLMQTKLLAEMIADYYEEFRSRINRSLLPGEKPLPYMSPATVIDHFRTHTADPQVRQVIILEELQEMRQELLKVVMEKHNKKKMRRVNKANFDAYEKAVKLELFVAQKDVSKMAFFSAGARVNNMGQGPVATNTKTLFDHWRKQRPGASL
ncbi:MAG: hypothetical protein K2Q45_06840 [Nitrosomonas sp.]|nr:hypothetical protein [Nitrosomonas sp.]